jgi:hypothetical protein
VLEIELNGDGSVRKVSGAASPEPGARHGPSGDRRCASCGAVRRRVASAAPWRYTEVFLFDDTRRFKPRTLDRMSTRPSMRDATGSHLQ